MNCDALRAQMNAILALLQSLNQSLADANSKRNSDYVAAVSADTFVPGLVPPFPPDAASVQARITAIQQWGAANPGHETDVTNLITKYQKLLSDLNTIDGINANIALAQTLLSNVVQQMAAQGC